MPEKSKILQNPPGITKRWLHYEVCFIRFRVALMHS